jgi:uncharacterized protein YijF (DUF1287 family)
MRLARLAPLLLLACGAAAAAPDGATLARAARAQVGVTLAYDPAYTRIPYPNGDLPRDRGVCTDVVVRAFREAGIDLQDARARGHARALRRVSRANGGCRSRTRTSTTGACQPAALVRAQHRRCR